MANTGKILFIGTYREKPVELFVKFKEWVDKGEYPGLKNVSLEHTHYPCIVIIHCDRLTEQGAQKFWDKRYWNQQEMKLFDNVKAFVCDATYGDVWKELTHENITKGWDNYKPGDTMG